MYNYTNTALALFLKYTKMTEPEAQILSKEMASKIHPATLDEAIRMVDSIPGLDKDLDELWLNRVKALEDEVEKLKARLSHKKAKVVSTAPDVPKK